MTINPTFIGGFAVLWWGLGIPMARIFQSDIGLLAYVGVSFVVMALLGFTVQVRRGTIWNPSIFRHPAFFARGFFMCFHVVCFCFASLMVQTHYVPLVILLNYFWPTAVILYSVLLAGVPVRRWGVFAVGLVTILSALTIEIAGEMILSPMNDLTPMDYLSCIVVFIGANAWGLYSALSRRYGEHTGTGTVIPFYHVAMLPLFVAALVTEPQVFTMEWDVIVFVVLYSCVGFLAYLAWDFGMRKGSIITLSLMADFIPWLSLLFAALLLEVEIGIKTVLSAILLVVGAMITRFGTLEPGVNFFGRPVVFPPADQTKI